MQRSTHRRNGHQLTCVECIAFQRSRLSRRAIATTMYPSNVGRWPEFREESSLKVIYQHLWVVTLYERAPCGTGLWDLVAVRSGFS